jgi:hypothetical protein
LYFLQPPVASSGFRPNIFFSTSFWNTLCSDHSTEPVQTQGPVQYFLIWCFPPWGCVSTFPIPQKEDLLVVFML